MTSMIDAVARALAAQDKAGVWFDGGEEAVCSNYPGQTARYREKYWLRARAAIEAMRFANEEMCMAGRDELDNRDAIVGTGEVGLVYRLMIDAALKEQP